MSNNKLVYIGFSYLHHKGTHSGYHQIKNHLSYDYLVDIQSFFEKCCRKNNTWDKILSRLYQLFFSGLSAIPWYFVKCSLLALFKGNLTFHFIYGENSYRNIPFLHVRGCKTVCTFHQPFEWFNKQPKWLKRLHTIDNIILVKSSDVELFEKETGKNNVTYIPHGIYTSFYFPLHSIKKEKMVLTVGNWLRDYEFADRIYKSLLRQDSEIKIVVIASKDTSKIVAPNERITILSGLSDEELRYYYRKCACVFLPLVTYTANNSILEASAVGCQIVIASNQKGSNYLPDKDSCVLKMDEDLVVKELMKRVNHLSSCSILAEYVKQTYDWSVIAERTKCYLENI